PREGQSNLYQKLATGVGNDELLLKSDEPKVPTDWSPDGRHVLFMRLGQKGFDLWALPLFDERQPVPFLRTDFWEGSGRFSPDGRWVTYVSTESGKAEVYVQSFPASDGKWKISNGGGASPHWRRDGRELFYLSDEREGVEVKLMAVEVDGSGDTFEASLPKRLFELRVGGPGGLGPHYDVTADGQRFLVNTPVEENAPSSPSPVTVVTNWAARLKR
ncbi:MAG: TolB family protein, partial [Pyrinomonadaceae bacterium]